MRRHLQLEAAKHQDKDTDETGQAQRQADKQLKEQSLPGRVVELLSTGDGADAPDALAASRKGSETRGHTHFLIIGAQFPSATPFLWQETLLNAPFSNLKSNFLPSCRKPPWPTNFSDCYLTRPRVPSSPHTNALPQHGISPLQPC